MHYDETKHKPVQSIPQLFKIIMKADELLGTFFSQKVLPFHKANAMIRERRSMSRDAERALSWNTNKGKTA